MQRTFGIKTYLVCCIETSWFYWKSLRNILDICCRCWIIGLITIPLQHFSDNHIDFICFGVPMQTIKLISVIWGCYTMLYEATLCILIYKQNCQWSPNIGQRCPISLQRGVKLFVQSKPLVHNAYILPVHVVSCYIWMWYSVTKICFS